MCVVSAVSDPYRRPEMWPAWPQTIPFPSPTVSPSTDALFYKEVTREEFNALKKQVEELKKLLEEARVRDIMEGNPDCEMEEKVFVIKKLAELVGVNLGDVFPND